MKRIIIPKTYKYISAFISMKCNLECSFCLNKFDENFNRKRFNELSGKEWVDALNKIESRPDVPITFSGGEPFLHKDLPYIINNLKQELNIDILTNLFFSDKILDKFISKVDPNRVKRDSLYASIRVSYHPEQMGDGEMLIERVSKLQKAGFSVGVWSVQYPGSRELEAITQMQFRCKNKGIDFRLKDFTGLYGGEDDLNRPFSILYGNYSKYPNSVFQKDTKSCQCKTSELLIGPGGDAYRCHRDLYAKEFSIGNITRPDFQIADDFKFCNKYGQCHPCDVKVKTDSKQRLGNTSVEIKDVK